MTPAQAVKAECCNNVAGHCLSGHCAVSHDARCKHFEACVLPALDKDVRAEYETRTANQKTIRDLPELAVKCPLNAPGLARLNASRELCPEGKASVVRSTTGIVERSRGGKVARKYC